MIMSEETPKLTKLHTYAVQIVFAISITVGSQSANFSDITKWGVFIARCVVYLYLIRGSKEAVQLAYQAFRTKGSVSLARVYQENHKHFYLFGGAVAFLVYLQQRIIGEEFLFLFIATLITQYPDMENESKVITYGRGMACSYFEGYLNHVLPSDGYMYEGFENNLRVYEGSESVRVPVKRLFIIITKDLYCPPDLKEFNKQNAIDLPYLEVCKPLMNVVKSVAGVKDRIYRNSVYKIVRPGRARPVYLAAECATPLHTLYLALRNRALFDELEGINKEEVVSHFCGMLQTILRKSPGCQNKCELVYYDNTDPTQYLPELLLQKIREIEPNFEDVITREE